LTPVPTTIIPRSGGTYPTAPANPAYIPSPTAAGSYPGGGGAGSLTNSGTGTFVPSGSNAYPPLGSGAAGTGR